MRQPFRTVVIGAGLLLAGGCTAAAGDGDEARDESLDVSLAELVNESARIESDLDAAENRIIRACLESEGFTAHDEEELATPEPVELDSVSGGHYPHEASFPDPAAAAEVGFGMWAQSEEALESGEAEAYEQDHGEWVDEPEPADNSAFTALPEAERRAWYVAYVGEEKALGFEWKFTSDGGVQEGPVTVDRDAMDARFAAPGGCELQMIEAVYGEPRLVEADGEDGFDRWEYRPANPVHESDAWKGVDLAYADAMAGAQAAFTGCLAERGLPGWEFTEAGGLPVWEYFAPLYLDESILQGSDTGAEAPPLPDDVPDDYEDRKAYEIGVAVDFVECDAETGFTEESVRAYDQAHVDAYTAVEDDLYAWQSAMNDALVRAQEVIGG
ncbi:hypothetical protein GCM10009830_12520 [Glycomyces endophyticus]|uniref:Uncharacterized protein n=1 Tax=Glycomyces endophyticus TaxID=480996 RepID=A0ABN2GB43_9ACTN